MYYSKYLHNFISRKVICCKINEVKIVRSILEFHLNKLADWVTCANDIHMDFWTLMAAKSLEQLFFLNASSKIIVTYGDDLF